MRFFLFSIFGGCLAISLAQASVANKNVNLVGYVSAFDTKAITVDSANQRYAVPRNFYPDKVKSGDLVTVPLSPDQFKSLKHTTVAKKK